MESFIFFSKYFYRLFLEAWPPGSCRKLDCHGRRSCFSGHATENFVLFSAVSFGPLWFSPSLLGQLFQWRGCEQPENKMMYQRVALVSGSIQNEASECDRKWFVWQFIFSSQKDPLLNSHPEQCYKCGVWILLQQGIGGTGKYSPESKMWILIACTAISDKMLVTLTQQLKAHLLNNTWKQALKTSMPHIKEELFLTSQLFLPVWLYFLFSFSSDLCCLP